MHSGPQYSILWLLHCQLPKTRPRMPASCSTVSFRFHHEVPVLEILPNRPLRSVPCPPPDSTGLCVTSPQARVLAGHLNASWASSTCTWTLLSAWTTHPLPQHLRDAFLSLTGHSKLPSTPVGKQSPSSSLI